MMIAAISEKPNHSSLRMFFMSYLPCSRATMIWSSFSNVLVLDVDHLLQLVDIHFHDVSLPRRPFARFQADRCSG